MEKTILGTNCIENSVERTDKNLEVDCIAPRGICLFVSRENKIWRKKEGMHVLDGVVYV